MVGFDRAVFGGYGCAFDQRQQVALHTFTGYIGTTGIGARANFVDFIQKHDAVLFDSFNRHFDHGIVVEQLVGLIRDQRGIAVCDGHLLARCAPAHFAENLAQVHHTAHASAGLAGDFETTKRIGCVSEFQIDNCVVKLAGFEFLAEHIAGGGARVFASDGGDHAFFGGFAGFGGDVFAHVVACVVDRGFCEIADDLFDIAADIANLGELCRFDFNERRAREFCQAAGNLGFTNASGSDHQDVLWVYFVT